jgi:hypothetical protein
VLDAPDWRKLLDSIPTGTMHDLGDRVLIAAADAQSEDAPRDLRCY